MAGGIRDRKISGAVSGKWGIKQNLVQKKAIGYEHERGGSSRCGERLMLRELNRP